MKDQLTDREKEIFAAVRAFSEAEILPIVNEYWERGEFPFDLIPKLAALNLVGDYNLGDHGCTSMSAVAAGLVTYELSRIDGSIATFFAVHVGLAMQSINILGSEEQRQRYLPGDGAPGKNRRVRTDRARARFGRRHPRGHRGAARR
jgi:glutaryl-CoA dehydrogenase